MESFARKARLLFETGTRPVHVTFDDGRGQRRNLSWQHYVETRWEYLASPDCLHITIGNWIVTILGHNLGPLFQVIEERSLLRLVAQPDLAERPEHAHDCFATGILFFQAPAGGGGGDGQREIGFENLTNG